MSNQNDKLKQLKTSSMDRRLSIAKASLLAGTRWAASNATTIFSSEVEKESTAASNVGGEDIVWSTWGHVAVHKRTVLE